MPKGFFYIIKGVHNPEKIYFGSTIDINRRIIDHNRGNTRTTKNQTPWKLVYYEKFGNISAARRREKQIKKWKNR